MKSTMKGNAVARDAPVDAEDGVHFPAVETHLIHSRSLDQTFRIDILRPAESKTERGRYPVIYATDGNLTFDVLKGMTRALQFSGRPEFKFVLVGIGYPGDGPSVAIALRARDFTFPGFPRYLKMPQPWAGVVPPNAGTRSFGGAAHFQKFLHEELIPFVDQNYPTVPGDRTFFGHSSGGSFGLHTLFTDSRLFNNYIVVSPALCFHGEDAEGRQHVDDDFGLQLVHEFIACGRPLANVKLYLSVGTEEEFDAAGARWRFTSSFYRLTALLKSAALPGLSLTAKAFSGEGHATVWPRAFIDGVKTLFSDEAP